MGDRALYIVRRDLRLHDNPALRAALKHHSILAVFIDESEQIGGASKWWLHHALLDFEESMKGHGIPFVIRKGNYSDELKNILSETNANYVYWNRVYIPDIYTRDINLTKELQEKNVHVQTFESMLLLPPWSIINNHSTGFKVFTPYYRRFRNQKVPMPLMDSLPSKRSSNNGGLLSIPIQELKLLPKLNWDEQFHIHKPTERCGLKLFSQFMNGNLVNYENNRDFPSRESTSFLSPYLAFGQISPRYIWHKSLSYLDEVNQEAIETFLRQLVWREFTYHIIWHHPHITDQSINTRFSSFPWRSNDELFTLWSKGKTGYPIVDAGMRELWQTGSIPNRIRMITSSFLIKHLLIPWQRGADWFLDTLVDADPVINSFNWQWVAGTGTDSSPFFRIFNPVLQGNKFDPDGTYIKKWIPELKCIPTKYIHTPWLASEKVLKEQNIYLGTTYPFPIIEHKYARQRALDLFKQLP